MITSTWFTTRAAVTTLLLWRVRIAAICHQRRAVARAATPPNGHLEVIGSWILPAVRPGQVRVYVCGRALTWPGTVPFGAFCCISDFVARRRSHSLEAPNLDNFAIKTTGLSQACPVQRLFHFIVANRRGPALGGPHCDDFHSTRVIRPLQSFLSAQLGPCTVN